MANQYKVKAGDTLYKIARQHGISLSDLLALNPQISDPNFIQINDLINLPDSSDDNHDVDPEELDIMARTIFGEAEGESDLGKVAVGWVIMNRVAKQTWYGRDVIGVCLWPWQFSCWNPGTPRRTIIESVRNNNTHFQKCLESAKKVLTSSEPDPTGGATHYHANYISPPAWTYGATFTVQIGKHLFYKNVD
jgi:spore germination cell wall hydrolase CwlJ-like protein